MSIPSLGLLIMFFPILFQGDGDANKVGGGGGGGGGGGDRGGQTGPIKS